PRESFLDAFLLFSMGVQMVASTRPAGTPRSALFAAAGAASFVTWLGKPTYALFTAIALVALVFDEDLPRRRRAIGAFLAGGLAGAVVPLLFLVTCGDLARWAELTFVDVPTTYRFVWSRSASEVLATRSLVVSIASATSAVLVLLVATGPMACHATPLALPP